MTVKSVAIRFGAEGEQQVVRSLAKIGDAGEAAARRYADTMLRAERDAEGALRRREMAERKAAAAGIDPAVIARLKETAAANDNGASAAKRHQMGMAGLGMQLQDTTVQVIGGTNAFLALAIQLPQAAGQMANMGGATGKVATLLAGPWGIAVSLALAGLGKLTEGLLEESENAKAAREATEAHRKAVLALAEAQDKAILTAERKQSLDVAGIKIDLDAALAARERAQAELAKAKAGLEALNSPGMDGERGIGFARRAAADQIAGLEGLLAANRGELDKLKSGFDAGWARMISARVDTQRSPEGRINRRYDDQRAEAQATLTGTANTAKLVAKLREIEDARERELKAIEKSAAARTRDAETLSSGAVAKMLRAELPGVQVTSTTGGKHVNNSYHYKGQAIDFVPAGGMGSMTKEDVRRIFTSRGIEIVELLGPGDPKHDDHFHVAWTKGKLALDDFTAAARHARDAQQELDDLMRAARDAPNLLANYQEESERAAEQAGQRARTLLGIGNDDPLGDVLASGKRQVDEDVTAWNAEQARRAQVQADDIQTLAGLYQTAFTGGSRGLWQSFKQMGLQVISELLARWTATGQLGGGGGGGGMGGLAGLLGSVVGGLFGGGGNIDVGGLSADKLLAGLPGLGTPDFSTPGFAIGTPGFSSGGAALVGEHGPELAFLPRGTAISTAGETRRLMERGAAPGINITYAPQVDARGAGPREIDQLRGEMQRMQAEFPDAAIAAVLDGQQRGYFR